MGKAIFISGTGTDIGKTIASTFLKLAYEEMGYRTVVFKPLQTGLTVEGGKSFYPDIHWYHTELEQSEQDTGLYCMAPAASPHLAAKLTHTTIEPIKIRGKIAELCGKYDVVLVEGAGGLAVPIQETWDSFYMTKDLIKECQMPVILVSPSGLGAIHDLVVTVQYAESHQLDIGGIIMNHFDQSDSIHHDNFITLKRLHQHPVLTVIPNFDQPIKAKLVEAAASFAKSDGSKQLKNILEAKKHDESHPTA
ncbi:dethiobiotin synthetase [Scopulibacillus darangshiensis]|uniref:ATP-dependent dethiobiotin synthetase BioD n=1 Tax=Scopulibacillus darangshiensis TaxID=442528 RepID=A0A4R2NWM8_9BACL|nr:dethiobiotin synthase [Scopulibacillus darangshiensis]TCP26001.1 dethiobiotin synthetase [Scopulibacillus darangshiensis]